MWSFHRCISLCGEYDLQKYQNDNDTTCGTTQEKASLSVEITKSNSKKDTYSPSMQLTIFVR